MTFSTADGRSPINICGMNPPVVAYYSPRMPFPSALPLQTMLLLTGASHHLLPTLRPHPVSPATKQAHLSPLRTPLRSHLSREEFPLPGGDSAYARRCFEKHLLSCPSSQLDAHALLRGPQVPFRPSTPGGRLVAPSPELRAVFMHLVLMPRRNAAPR